MGTAKSLHDAVDSQQYTRRDNQAGCNAGYPGTQQGTRSECRTRTRCSSDSRKMCTEGGSAAARSRGFVVEQELSEFLKANRMAGVIVARPRLGQAKRSRAKESATCAQRTGETRRIGASR